MGRLAGVRLGRGQPGQEVRQGRESESSILLFSAKPSKKKTAASKTKDVGDHGSLIDLDIKSSKSKSKDDGWNNNWEDDAWESLNN